MVGGRHLRGHVSQNPEHTNDSRTHSPSPIQRIGAATWRTWARPDAMAASAKLCYVHSDAEPAPGALAPRPAAQSLAETSVPLSGGAGLFDHSSRDAVSPSVGMIGGLLSVALTIGIATLLVTMNPSFPSGTSSGTDTER